MRGGLKLKTTNSITINLNEKKMKKVFIYAMGGIILPFLASCGDDKNETKYEGVNKIYLSAQDPVINFVHTFIFSLIFRSEEHTSELTSH